MIFDIMAHIQIINLIKQKFIFFFYIKYFHIIYIFNIYSYSFIHIYIHIIHIYSKILNIFCETIFYKRNIEFIYFIIMILYLCFSYLMHSILLSFSSRILFLYIGKFKKFSAENKSYVNYFLFI